MNQYYEFIIRINEAMLQVIIDLETLYDVRNHCTFQSLSSLSNKLNSSQDFDKQSPRPGYVWVTMKFIILLSDMGPHNITIRCWEFNLNMSLPAQFLSIRPLHYEGPWNKSYTLNKFMLSPLYMRSS